MIINALSKKTPSGTINSSCPNSNRAGPAVCSKRCHNWPRPRGSSYAKLLKEMLEAMNCVVAGRTSNHGLPGMEQPTLLPFEHLRKTANRRRPATNLMYRRSFPPYAHIRTQQQDPVLQQLMPRLRQSRPRSIFKALPQVIKATPIFSQTFPRTCSKP